MPSAGAGQLLVKQTHMSLDPAMIGWMSPDTESYVPPVGLGEVMRSSGIGQVIEKQLRSLIYILGAYIIRPYTYLGVLHISSKQRIRK